MAITFNTAQSNANLGGAPVEEVFTTLSGDTELIVGVSNRGSGTVTAVSFNGDALTLITSRTQDATILYLFRLINPDIGAFNLTFTLGGGATNISYAAGTWDGSNTGIATPASGVNSTGSGASLATSFTSTNGWNVLVAYATNGSITASTGSTLRSEAESAGHNIAIYDSNAQVVGAQSMSVTAEAASLIVGIIMTIPVVVTSSITDTSVSTDRHNSGIASTFSDTNITTDLFSVPDYLNKQKSTTTWVNTAKS